MLCWKRKWTSLLVMFRVSAVLVLFLAVVFAVSDAADESDVSPEVYTDQFVMRVEGGPEVAKELARKHGF
ncbi:hypothetical protein X975_26210, partial [Stegodyphus mimosarum]